MISGKAKLAGVMGWPISHSRSPQLHGYWLDKYAIDGAYLPLAVDPKNIEPALRALPTLGFKGCNLTVPHKELAMNIVDNLSERAKRIGAVNTVVVQEDGSLFGHNTDGFGFLENLKSEAPQWNASNGPAVVLGAGGAARAILAALIDDGVKEVRLTNRTHQRAVSLREEFGSAVCVVDWEERSQALEGAALLVNSSTLGMTGQSPLEIDLSALPKEAVVNDIVYAPLMTDLLEQAKKQGNEVVGGIGMLLHQARPGFEAWFGQKPEVDEALKTLMTKDLV
ncbi:MAG: shikimate dehydrogenase [Rhodospirillales bacterium]|nr:shikimate dehydrogenase [Rhodospirillales bacterium]